MEAHGDRVQSEGAHGEGAHLGIKPIEPPLLGLEGLGDVGGDALPMLSELGEEDEALSVAEISIPDHLGEENFEETPKNDEKTNEKEKVEKKSKS